jgi:hypothetical protein
MLVFCGALALVAATAWLVCRRLGVPSRPGRLLAGYLLGFGEVVAITLALSLVDAFRAWTLVSAVAVVFGGVVVAELVRPAHRSPRLGAPRRPRLRELDPAVLVLGLGVVLGLLYSGALLLFTPPNDWDAMTYHLARAAFWMQQQAVGYVPDSDVLRIDVNPPNAEIASAFTMLLSHGDRFVGLAEYLAALATAVGVYGIARRIRLGHGEALFGALVFLSLPVVVLQSSSALNDLVVASFLVAATYFLLGDTRAELVLGSLALALALGTKFTAFIALPLLVLVLLVGVPRPRWPATLLAALLGVLAGSYWLVVNLVASGEFDGGAGDVLDQNPDRGPLQVLARSSRMFVNLADDLNLGPDRRLYAIVAMGLAVALVAAARGRRGWVTAAAVIVLGCLPLALATIREVMLQTHEKLWITLGHRELAFIDHEREALSPSTVRSYFGPVAFLLLTVGVVVAVLLWRRGLVPRLALLLAAAPAALILLVSVALVYDPWRARFLVYAFALAASTWGLVLRFRWLAWPVTSIACVTIGLAFVHSIEKPAGVRLFDDETSAGVWGEPRERVQAWLRPGGTAELVQYFGREPSSGRVGLRLTEDDWVYPYFGRTFGRDVEFVPDDAATASLDWLVVAPGRAAPADGSWSLALRTRDGWRVYRPA